MATKMKRSEIVTAAKLAVGADFVAFAALSGKKADRDIVRPEALAMARRALMGTMADRRADAVTCLRSLTVTEAAEFDSFWASYDGKLNANAKLAGFLADPYGHIVDALTEQATINEGVMLRVPGLKLPAAQNPGKLLEKAQKLADKAASKVGQKTVTACAQTLVLFNVELIRAVEKAAEVETA